MLDWRRVKERVFIVTVTAVTILTVAPLFHIIGMVALKGSKTIVKSGIEFFTATPGPPGSEVLGGVGPAILGSLWLAVTTAIVGVPLSVLTAMFIVEYKSHPLARIAMVFSGSLLEIPTVLIGMLVFLVIVAPMGHYSLLAGSIALAIVMLPYTVSYVERALENVPQTYREAGYALGMTRAQVAVRVVAGIARRGMVAGVLIGISKVVAETAPLLFTIGSARSNYPLTPLDLLKPGDALPLLIFQFAQTPYENWQELAWGSAFILTAIVLTTFIAMRILVREVRL
ncbi:phosphate ABC transporter permease PstA [Aeropyrum camini]|uniref:Phosphate transport system permease protein PstA n=1 Tax=Aeropyrum camini SY1 = JCM 12091 TaxID=1198449 RepID=U3TAQ5_9CREN|nr:phosphate ABC transporter permease PstA [Aeropyrum camini]BAN89506.1 phosphate ABC transporter permease [Aeropyrum camini SY1 = JCM 12091]